S
ncbi:hypothetical protein CCHL11_10414, partial [Colletotrichum chlorophyti]